MPDPPSLEEVVAALDDRRSTVVAANGYHLHRQYDFTALIPVYAEALQRIRNGTGRMHILWWFREFAREDSRVVAAAMHCLNDLSRQVRRTACSVLAYSLRKDTLPSLVPLLSHSDPATRRDAEAAIDAIEHQNHHYYVDRRHTRNAFWILRPEDDPDRPPRVPRDPSKPIERGRIEGDGYHATWKRSDRTWGHAIDVKVFETGGSRRGRIAYACHPDGEGFERCQSLSTDQLIERVAEHLQTIMWDRVRAKEMWKKGVFHCEQLNEPGPPEQRQS